MIISNLKYLLVGAFFGLILTKSEVISWWRIQEMFRLDSFHMYGVIGSAVVVGALSMLLMKALNVKTFAGEALEVGKKSFHMGIVFGGLLFGLGWALTGACPGPLYAQLGYGMPVVILTIVSAIAGTWTYGLLRERLPH